jgi:hypothetical protein
VNDGSLGDISNAVPVTCTLVPVGPGLVVTVPATATGGGVGGTLTATCSFSGVPVNAYDVKFTIGGNFYQDTLQTVVTVYDPSLGFSTGGGTIINPNTLFPANFGFNVKYQKDGSVQGSLLYAEHRGNDDVVVKSSSMGSLAIVGNQAIFSGTATLNGASSYSFRIVAVDNAEPGVGKDQFGLQVNDSSGTLTFNPVLLTGGNIQVPQPSKK